MNDILKLYIADMLHRIWLYPRDIRNFTAKESEKRIASKFGRTA
jgi:hypothetical protein